MRLETMCAQVPSKSNGVLDESSHEASDLLSSRFRFMVYSVGGSRGLPRLCQPREAGKIVDLRGVRWSPRSCSLARFFRDRFPIRV
jgi:hypothetical protein